MDSLLRLSDEGGKLLSGAKPNPVRTRSMRRGINGFEKVVA